jgi:hypothetical protein
MLRDAQFWALPWHVLWNPHARFHRFSLRALDFSNKFICAFPASAPFRFTHHMNCRQGTRIVNLLILKEINSKIFCANQ